MDVMPVGGEDPTPSEQSGLSDAEAYLKSILTPEQMKRIEERVEEDILEGIKERQEDE